MFNKSGVISVADYYEDPGVRELCHRIKSGDMYACTDVAEQIINHLSLPEGATLIPVPSRKGIATTNLTICLAIAKHTGAHVVDCIRGDERASLYDLKKAGLPISTDLLSLRLTKDAPEGPCYLFDAVVDSGTTMDACLSLFKEHDITPLTFAMTERNRYIPKVEPVQNVAQYKSNGGAENTDAHHLHSLRRHR